MSKTICGVDCGECSMKNACGGCTETNGRPFGGDCVLALCCHSKGQSTCGGCSDSLCSLKKQIADEFNKLGIKDMPEVTDLNALSGAYINLEYKLPGGQTTKFLDDSRIYLGNQLCKKNSDKCYGIIADENILLVCEYDEGGTNAEIVTFTKRNK